jgi:hypothetical protein
MIPRKRGLMKFSTGDGFESRAEQKARISQKTVDDLDVSPGDFGVEPSQSTLRTKRPTKECSMPDAESIEHATVSFGFDVEVTDSFCGYVRLLHLDATIRTLAFTHCVYIHPYSRLLKKSGHGFTRGNECVTEYITVSEMVRLAPGVRSVTPFVDECRDDDTNAEEYGEVNPLTVGYGCRTEHRDDSEYHEDSGDLGFCTDQAIRPFGGLL